MNSNLHILTTDDLTIGFEIKNKKNVISKDLNIGIKKGKLTALVGENGIGKSTLLRTLTGIQKPLNGQVIVDNKNLNSYNALELAKKLSVVLTERIPMSNLTVYELIALGRQPYTNWLGKLNELDLEKINTAIQITQIEHLLDKKYYEISDGQLQVVLICRALAQDTPLIILDEPTTHLDLHHKVSVFKLIKKLTEETNISILLSTHDIDLAIQICDEMIVMSKDSIHQDQPCNLISKGIFNSLFQDSSITFDANKGTFIIV